MIIFTQPEWWHISRIYSRDKVSLKWRARRSRRRLPFHKISLCLDVTCLLDYSLVWSSLSHGCLVRDIILYLKSEWLASSSAGPCFMLQWLAAGSSLLLSSSLLFPTSPVPFLHSPLRAVCLSASLARPSHHNTISCDTPHIFSADHYRAGAQEMRHYVSFKSFKSLCRNKRVMKTIC